MKLALIGATGFVGSAVLNEALRRGHQVTAIARNTSKLLTDVAGLTKLQADIFNINDMAGHLKDHDAVISAYNPGWTNPNLYNEALRGSQALHLAVKQSGVKRFFVVGGAGSLFVAPDTQLIDTPQFPPEWKPGALAARDYLDIIKKDDSLDWTFLSPAIEMHQGTSGQRKAEYRIGKDNPVFDQQGRSAISVEDLAVAIIDEIEKPQHIRERFTVAY